MPINGLTKGIEAAFKESFRLRKGVEKDENNPAWKPEDLTYFRPDFRPDEKESAAIFYSAYGKEPERIFIRFPFRDIDRCWDANYTCYNKSGQLLHAGDIPGREGLYFHYLRHNKTNELLVRNNVDKSGNYVPFDPRVPVYSYKSRKGEDVAVYAKTEGRLKFMVPELKRAVFGLLVTKSIYDCANISKEFLAITELISNVGYPLPMVKMILSRRWDMVCCTIHGQNKHMEQKNLCHIDMDPEWSAPLFDMLESIRPGVALPAPIEFDFPELPAQIFSDEEPEGADDPTTEEPIAARSMQPATSRTIPAPKPPEAKPGPISAPQAEGPLPANGNGARPYTPDQVAARLNSMAETFTTNQWTLRPNVRKMLPANMELCFAGDPKSSDMRHTVLRWLFSVPSTNDLTDAQCYAIHKWLDAQEDSGGAWLPNSLSVAEAQAVYAEALRAEGQLDLFPAGSPAQVSDQDF